MKVFNISAILGILLLISCSDVSSPEPIQHISEISIFDVGNEGNSSDILVVFSIENVARISQFSILVIPTQLSNNFSKEQGLLLTPDRYKTLSLSNSEQYSARLLDMLDVEGNLIVTDKKYVVKILMSGQQFNQLSILESNELILTDQGIYNGYYEGAFVHNVINQGSFINPARLVQLNGQITSSETNRYIGTFADDNGTILFFVEGDSINDFEVSGGLAFIARTYMDCDSINTGTLRGIIKSDLKMEIIGEGCPQGTFEMRLSRTILLE